MKILKLRYISLLLIFMSTSLFKASDPTPLTQVGKFLFNNRRTIIPLVALIYYKDKASKDSILKVCALILGNELVTSLFSSDPNNRNILKNSWQIDDATNEPDFTRLPVLLQDKDDCGYHAIKNGRYVYQMLAGLITNSVCLEKLLSSDDTVFPLEDWRKYVLAKFRDNLGKGTNLTDAEIDDLIKNKSDFSNINYIIIPNILDEESIGLDGNLTNIITLFREESERIQLFILGTMRHFADKDSEQVRGSIGHWISIIVVKKDNKFKYYAMDSLSSGNAIGVLFRKLKHLIENQALETLQLIPQLEQKITAIESNLTDAENKSGDNRLRNAMVQIQNIIDIFTRHNFSKFNKYVLKVDKILNSMQSNIKGLSQEQMGWIEVELSLIHGLQ